MQSDPGWRRPLKRMLLLLIPVFQFFAFRRLEAGGGHALTSLRSIHLSMVASSGLFGIALLFIVPSQRWWSVDRNTWFIWVVLAAGCLNLLGVRWVRNRPLTATSNHEIVTLYNGLFFIGVGYAMGSVLIALVGTIVMNAGWVYLVGLAFTMIGLLLIAPSRREIARRDEQLIRSGSPLSLSAALEQGEGP